MTGLKVVDLWAMNFGPPGKDGHIRGDLIREVRALCHEGHGSKIGFVTEGLGWHPLPTVGGQRVIHDTSTPSRANVGLYIARGLDVLDVEYIPHEEGWSRTEHNGGEHPPRSTLKALLRAGDGKRTLAVATHGPDPRADNPKARTEWVSIMVEIFKSSPDPVIMGGDPNHLFGEVLRKLGNPEVALGGESADAVLTRGYVLTDATKRSAVGGVHFTNDHHGALVGRATRRPKKG